MATECKMEFYFKASALKKLLDCNPHAKGIIIKQVVKSVVNATTKKVTNVLEISACIANSSEHTQKLMMLKTRNPNENDCVEVGGCPYPPGCPPSDII